MCGIIGYLGHRNVSEVLLSGLTKLEYRGYDSAGIATVENGEIALRRSVGKLENLEKVLAENPISGNVGIGHTRWATHGRPSEVNAHPHQAGKVVLVHNGIIENYRELRRELEEKGCEFQSETDTEIVAHLINEFLKTGITPLSAVQQAVSRIEGAYAFCVAFAGEQNTLIAAKNSSPLIVGFGENEAFVASDVPAVLKYTNRVDFLNDGEIAVLSREKIEIYNAGGEIVTRPEKIITWDPIATEKGGHKHFMHKEIFEQPRVMVNALDGRIMMYEGDVKFDNFTLDEAQARLISRVCIVACGTAWHAALMAKTFIEKFARIPVEVDIGSEFRYRDPLVDEHCLAVAISQSGETADTLAALREAKSKGARTLAICNVMESTLAREADDVIYTHAGPEIGVASTKAFISQIAVAYLFAIFLARRRDVLNEEDAHEALTALSKVPILMKRVLQSEPEIRNMAKTYRNMKGYLFLGRGVNFPIALEGALKLKEISYLHAEGYAAGEMKHGPIALVDENMLTVGIVPIDGTYEKMRSNLEEIRAREGRILAICSEGDEKMCELAHDLIRVPIINAMITPFLTALPLQLLSYHIADLKGNDVDQPRNLAKSVTVE